MKTSTETRELALRWLRSPLPLTGIQCKAFPLGPASQDEIVTTNRLILILEGRMDYTLEGSTHRMAAGTQFLVPAWSRRVWSVPRGGPCRIIWCEFDEAGSETTWATFRRRKLTPAEFLREKRKYRSLLRLHDKPPSADSDWTALLLEAELKSLALRFLANSTAAATAAEDQPSARAFHPRVKQMLKWLGEHFLEHDVVEQLYRESGMTRNYFRRLFTDAMQIPPHVHIERLRLRRARFLLHEKDWPIKQIAAACGYEDPLYFSRIYHRFWGHPPARERLSS